MGPRPQADPPTLNQAGWIPNSSTYEFNTNKYPNLSITGDNLVLIMSNWRRWSMLYNSSGYYLYVFKSGSRDTLYRYKWNGKSYALDSDTEITILNVTDSADVSSFSMLSDGLDRLFMKVLGDPGAIHQWSRKDATTFQVGAPGNPNIHAGGEPVQFPPDTDWGRWTMMWAEGFYGIYAFKLGSNTQLYTGAWNPKHLLFEHGYPPGAPKEINLVGTPADSNLASASMLYDGSTYRFYFQTLIPPQT